MTWLLSLRPSSVVAAAASILLLALVAWGSVQTMRLSWAEANLAAEKLDRANELAVRLETARRAEARNAAKSAAHAAETVRLSDELDLERARESAALADAARERDELRAAVEAARSAARDQRANADAVTCRPVVDQGSTGWDLFRDADQLAEKLAGAAERRAAEVRALKRQLVADRLACGGADGGNGSDDR